MRKPWVMVVSTKNKLLKYFHLKTNIQLKTPIFTKAKNIPSSNAANAKAHARRLPTLSLAASPLQPPEP
jgi:hypothetical protein